MSSLKEIKDAARQAFRDQQTQDTEGGVPDIVSFIAGFVAGARYREEKVNELANILDLKYKSIVELEAKLKEEKQAYSHVLMSITPPKR